jgi:hypothetical protein
MASGSFRVTITNGFFLALGGMSPISNSLAALSSAGLPGREWQKARSFHVLVAVCSILR